VKVALVTGSGGLIGSEAVRHFAELGFRVVGVDNDMRGYFFGPAGSTAWNVARLREDLGDRYHHVDLDVRDRSALDALVAEHAGSVEIVVHAAAQPSHDWAVREPFTDFDINAGGTLNLLEALRRHAAETPFVFLSTNKVYGDRPNLLPLEEGPARLELAADHAYFGGIDETMSIDQSLHSLFGASKVAADVLVQEYGRYFGMPTVCFRGGTLTVPQHSPHSLHGFLAYLMACTVSGQPYTVIGYGGKQVRDVIHCRDVVAAIERFRAAPRAAAVYNLGGGRRNSCSVLEAIELCEAVTGTRLEWSLDEKARTGDHAWWISSNGSFERDHPGWSVSVDLGTIAEELARALHEREPQS
jgi:CDP-paratose 2-epimerase